MALISVTKIFAAEGWALDYLTKMRWPKGVRCLSCDFGKVYSIRTRGKTGKPCQIFECGRCKMHFSVTTGTLFHDSHLTLLKWFMAVALMSETERGISANQIAWHIGVQYRTAWHLRHRIRRAMQEPNPTSLGG
jgi:transposase-like protein